MQKVIATSMFVITALTMLSGSAMAAFAASSHGGGTNVINVTVNCTNGTQAHKTASGSSSAVANVNVACTGGGGGGIPGPPGPPGKDGKDGQNATITIITLPQNTTSGQQFDAKHSSCTAPILLPCVKK
jgi:hypothetical protein